MIVIIAIVVVVVVVGRSCVLINNYIFSPKMIGDECAVCVCVNNDHLSPTLSGDEHAVCVCDHLQLSLGGVETNALCVRLIKLPLSLRMSGGE